MKIKIINEFIVIAILAIIFSYLNFSQTIAYIVRTPEGFIYPLAHNYVEDYYYYLHLIRQGLDGAWRATSRLTPEIFPQQFVNPFFLLLGHIARFGGISLPSIYTIARVTGGVGVIGVTYILICKVFPDSFVKRITALLFVFTSSYFWGWGGGGPKVPTLVHEWTELDPLFRLSYIPHHLWSKVFMLVTFLTFLKFLITQQRKYLAAACVAAVIAGFISPVVLATLLPALILWYVLLIVFSKREAFFWRVLSSWFLVLGSAVLVAIYHRAIQNGVFPWTSYLLWEKVQYAVTPANYVQSLGPNFFLFLFSVPMLVKIRHYGLLFIGWVLAGWVTLFLLAPIVPLTNSRYLGGYQFIPLGIGATIALFSFGDYLQQRITMLTRYVMPLVVSSLLFYNGVGLWISWKEHFDYIDGNRWNNQVFVPDDIWNSIAFLNKEASGKVVVAPLSISTMIPAFTSGRVVSGHKTITYEYDTKNSELASFYEETSTISARNFLEKYNAKYVLAYGDSRWFERLGLSLVYTNASIRIYTVP